MKLYEILKDIQDLLDTAEIDPETGELDIDEILFDMLESERDKKIENLIMYYKNLFRDIEKFDREIKSLSIRKQSMQNKQESLKRFLDVLHSGQKAKYGIHSIGYRKSSRVDGDVDILSDDYVTITRIPNKKSIKAILTGGGIIKGWKLHNLLNIQIK